MFSGAFAVSFREFFQTTNATGGFKDFLFSPLLGEDSHFDEYLLTGLKPPPSTWTSHPSPRKAEKLRKKASQLP